MNTLFQKITAVVGLLSLLSLTSCQPENFVTPERPATAPAQAVSNGIPLVKAYKLIKDGQATLTYYADGRLKQVTVGGVMRGSIAYSREYTYDDVNHVINATSSVGGKIALLDTYYLDPQMGRCQQSEQVDYTILDKPNPVHTQLNARWIYKYNWNGQLERVHNLFLPGSDRIEYSYNTEGDLTKMITFDQVAGQDGVLTQTLTLTYTQSPTLRGIPLADPYPLTASWMRLPLPNELTKGQPVPDQYLPIFGKPSKHLIMGAVQTKLAGNQALLNSLFIYQLNTAGYVTERRELDAHSAALLNTKPYDYQVINPGSQF